MDERRLEALVRRWVFGTSRRGLLRAGVGGAAGALAARLIRRGEAAGCRAVGEACRGDRQCCSGRCKHHRCRAVPGQGICTIRKDACRDANSTICGTSGPAGCSCRVTTRGTSFCGAGLSCRAGGICANDSDCEAVFGPGSACVRGCCPDLGGVACVARCPNPS